jgi:hypothetical protein
LEASQLSRLELAPDAPGEQVNCMWGKQFVPAIENQGNRWIRSILFEVRRFVYFAV